MSTACKSLTYQLALRNEFNLTQTQQIIVFFLGPFICISSIINVAFFLRGKKRSEPPADILLVVSVFGLIRLSSYLSAASTSFITKTVYDQVNPPFVAAAVPGSFREFCNGTGFVNVLCSMGEFVYNVVFCVYYVVKIRNPLKSWIRDNKQMHIFCLLLIIITTVVFYLTDLVGISILGVCGYRIGSGTIYIDIILSVSYFITLLVSSFFFLKYLRSISNLERKNQIYFRYYFKYLIISSIMYLIGLASLFFVTMKCAGDENDDVFQILKTVCNVTKLLVPVMVLAVIAGHPELRVTSFLKCCSELLNKIKPKPKLASSLERSSFYPAISPSPSNRTSILIQLHHLNNLNNQQFDFLTQIKDRNKACLLNTILGCLAIQESQYLQKFDTIMRHSKIDCHPTSIRIEDLRLSSYQMDEDQVYGWNFNQIHQFQLNDSITLSFSEIFVKNMSTLKIKFISFSSSVFKKLQQHQNFHDIYEKILPINNAKNIIDNIETDGGRSGQFFFFNYDKTIIIKTITGDELKVLRDRIEAYYDYLDRNQGSFIVKILGLYKAVNLETEEAVSFMLMGNILRNIPKKYILKSYDLKGSSYQRKVLKQKNIEQPLTFVTSKTLKDIDFHMLEGKVHISPADSQQIKRSIVQDVSFLCSQGLIDYSLILLKINYKKFLEEQDLKIDGLKMFDSTSQEGVVYVFGIIDYLQTWNIRKKGEKWYKSIFNKEESISSQDPVFYAERFMKSLINVILP